MIKNVISKIASVFDSFDSLSLTTDEQDRRVANEPKHLHQPREPDATNDPPNAPPAQSVAHLRADGAGEQLSGTPAASTSESPTGSGTEPESLVSSFPKNFHQILHLTKAPMFVTDADGNAVVWNEGMTELTGSTEADAKSVDQLSTAWYHDGRRGKTLADKIVDTHQDGRQAATPTHIDYDVERVDWVDFELYQDESTFTDSDGETRHIRFSAAPLYEDDEFVGVVEYVEDRTEDVREHQELESLIKELTTTLEAVGDGNLSARAERPAFDNVDAGIGRVVDALNETIAQLESSVEEIAKDSEHLRASAREVADRTESIATATHQQESSVREVSEEINSLSASVQEVAATADTVLDSAQTGVAEAKTGNERAKSAEETMDDVADATDRVVNDVQSLQQRIDEIDTVIDMIDDIAEQTNMLALNASIEAARAGEAGDGFAVVADEIKQLAGKSQDHADRIEDQITDIQENADRTVNSLESVNQKVHTGRDTVRTVQEQIDEVVEQVDDTAADIKQVASVSDDQAASAEEMASMIDEVFNAAEDITTDVEHIESKNAEHTDLADRIDRNLEQLIE